MTPEEAVEKLSDGGMPYSKLVDIATVLQAVKATAKADETRRCAKVALEITMGETGMHYGPATAKKILRSGGLEAEE